MDVPRIPVEPEVGLRWTQVAHGTRLIVESLKPVVDPAPGSALSADDAAYPRERLSAWVRSYLNAASDHLMLWANIVAPLQVFEGQEVANPARPYYTLARGALEAAAQAAWILEKAESTDRVDRHLRLLASDLDELAKAFSADGNADDAAATRKRAAAVEEHLGRTPAKVNYLDMVKAAASCAGESKTEAEVTWRIASGAAHGKNWFIGQTHTVVVGDEYEPGYYRAANVPDPAAVADVLELALTVLQNAALRYQLGMGFDPAKCIERARDVVARSIPLRPGVERSEVLKRWGVPDDAEDHAEPR